MKIRNLTKTLLSNNWYTLSKYAFEYQLPDGQWQYQEREAYDRGNGSTILLYNKEKEKILLTRQFRLPTYVNGNKNGMLIEACAGLLDQDDAENCIKKEAEEELGYRLDNVQKIFEAYMSPGSVTEIIYFFIAEYHDNMRISHGGGLAEEQENIEVLELDFRAALNMIESGEIKDGKTIMLLQYAELNRLCLGPVNTN